jgi:TRAP-type mannitol/chloroaromatic compound transport system permease small subunit
MTPTFAPAPAGARWLVSQWHRVECLLAVAAFGFIAVVLIIDVAGRELLGPIYKALDLKGSPGVFAAQKMSVYALVIGSFCGIGVATATGSHLLPRIGFGWVPESFAPTMNRIADVVTGVFFCGVAWYGWVYVQSSMQAGLRAQAFDMPIWPIQLAIPVGFLSAGLRYFFFAIWPALRPLPPEFQE